MWEMCIRWLPISWLRTRLRICPIVVASYGNNQGEYHSSGGLEVASEEGCAEVTVRGDSQLIVKQVGGEWSANESALNPLPDRVQ